MNNPYADLIKQTDRMIRRAKIDMWISLASVLLLAAVNKYDRTRDAMDSLGRALDALLRRDAVAG